jgi:predicted RNase H-like HicB family nuclease
MNHKYEIIIFWSNEDECFIAEVPELPGCSAWGDTYASAMKEVQIAMDLWVETAKEFGRNIPTPKGERLIFA